MVFSSTIFLFIFLPVVIGLYYLIKFIAFKISRPLQNILLTIASLFFYAWGEPAFVIALIASILWAWLSGLLVFHATDKPALKKVILGLSITGSLGFLFVFKYLSFALTQLKTVFHFTAPDNLMHIALPIGISFFTFQAISYVIDIYRNDGEMQKNPMNVALYVAFFPQLIAGPIVRYQTIARQIRERKETLSDFSVGLERFMIGFCKKVLLANNLALLADMSFDIATRSTAQAWLGLIAYTLQIFFDFSAYSDMAIGLGKMFGFHFSENFNYPYISKSITEFWRRWHISLGTWFRDYVYFPLGGSRVKSKTRLILNLLVVWFLTGVWHGANWTFFLWGLIYFLLLVIEKLSKPEIEHQISKRTVTLFTRCLRSKIFGRVYTLFFVMMGWVLFRAKDLSAARDYFRDLFGINGQLWDDSIVHLLRENAVFLVFGILFSTPIAAWLNKKMKLHDRSKFRSKIVPPVLTFLLLLLFITSVAYIVKGAYNPFIYFNF